MPQDDTADGDRRREVTPASARRPDSTVSYGPLSEQVADVWLPAGTAPAPLVVVVHGGFWRQQWDRAHAAPQAAGLAAAGHVVASVEYRRVGGAGGWPATLDDVALIGDTVPALVREIHPGRVAPDRTVLVGHSAGGHLATWSAARHRLPASSPWWRADPLPVRVVSLAGVLDLEMADRLGLGGHAARGLLGGSRVDLPDRYAAADPSRLVPSGVRTVLVHGSADEDVPVAISRSYVRAASAAGDSVVLHELPGIDHMSLVDPGSAAWPAVLAAVEEAVA